MPSFVCDVCQETLKKPKLDAHTQRCRGASFSCIDCYKSFKGTEYRQHFSCITEVEKYHGKKSEETKVPKPVAVQNDTQVKQELQKPLDAKPALAKLLKVAKEPLSLKKIKKSLKADPTITKEQVKKLFRSVMFSLGKDNNIEVKLVE